jgi:hypothetical protein
MATNLSNNSGLMIGLLIAVIVAIGAYFVVQQQNHQAKIETPAGTMKITTP